MSSVFPLSHLLSRRIIKLDYDQETPWFGELLSELNGEYDLLVEASEGGESFIQFKGQLEKEESGKYGESALLSGRLEAKFYTLCVQSGEIMTDNIEADVKVILVDEALKEKFHFTEEDVELFVGEEAFDLYYYQNNKIDVAPALSEHLYLNKNPYPKLN